MILGTVRDGFYDFVLLLHLVAVVVGFGGVLLNGVYGARASKLPPAEAAAVVETNYFVSTRVAEIAIYLVPLFGFGLVGLSDSGYSFSQTWIVASLVLYVIGLANAHIVLVPTQRHTAELLRETPPNGPKIAAAGKRLAAFGSFGQVLFLAIMILMIWKPGL